MLTQRLGPATDTEQGANACSDVEILDEQRRALPRLPASPARCPPASSTIEISHVTDHWPRGDLEAALSSPSPLPPSLWLLPVTLYLTTLTIRTRLDNNEEMIAKDYYEKIPKELIITEGEIKINKDGDTNPQRCGGQATIDMGLLNDLVPVAIKRMINKDARLPAKVRNTKCPSFSPSKHTRLV